MSDYFVSQGAHKRAEDGRCAMEWVSYLAGEPHSDYPACVCPVLTAFCVRFNDGLGDDQRQKLRPYLARTIGTRGDGFAERRGWLAADWLIRTYTPARLALAGQPGAARDLRALPPVLTSEDVSRAMEYLAGGAHSDYPACAPRDWAVAWTIHACAEWMAWQRPTVGMVRRRRTVAWVSPLNAACRLALAAATAAPAPANDEIQRLGFELLDRMLPTELIRMPVAQDAAAVCALPLPALTAR